MTHYFSLVHCTDGKRHDLSSEVTILHSSCDERKLIMFWAFLAFMGLLGFAVKLGQLSVLFVLLKLALIGSLIVIAALSAVLIYQKLNKAIGAKVEKTFIQYH